jgi:hypothetical protein
VTPPGATPCPSERPRGDGDPGRPPSAFATRPHHASSHAKAQRPLNNGRTHPPLPVAFSIPPCVREYSDRSSVSLRDVCSWSRHRSNSCDHGSGPVKATGSHSAVRTWWTFVLSLSLSDGRPSRATHVRRVSISEPIRPMTCRAGRNFVFPPKISPAACSVVSRPCITVGSLPFLIIYILKKMLLCLFYYIVILCGSNFYIYSFDITHKTSPNRLAQCMA